MTKISVDFTKKIGKIKPVHSVGQPPLYGMDFSMFPYLKEANIPYSRLHDVGGSFGGAMFVDIPNVFRDFNADPENPDAYDFGFTDGLITALVENDVEPFFRLGVTIENYVAIKAYHIYPPTDYEKWAKICEGIIRHYNEGWANGFHYNIKYWEIWNEPDNEPEMILNQCWRGTKEQFFELYKTASLYLKAKFPDLKIGGYSSCGFYSLDNTYVAEAKSSPRFDYFITFFEEFLEYAKKYQLPLDFFSWHSYAGIEQNKRYSEYARKKLDEAGYTKTELTCNEWNYKSALRGTARHAALATAMVLSFQNSPLDSAMFYDARLGVGVYGGMFDPLKRTPFPAYYGFKAFGELYRLGTQVKVTIHNKDVYAVAATNNNEGRILIVNTGESIPLQLDIREQKIVKCRCIDEAHNYEECELPDILSSDTVLYIETQKEES